MEVSKVIQLLKNNADMSSEIDGNVKIPISERNRDYTAIVNEVKFNAKWNISSIANDDKIEANIDGTNRWLGYVKGIKKNWKNRNYNILVRSGLSLLRDFKVEFDSLQRAINQTADFNSVVVVSNWSGDTVTELGHGLTNDQRVEVRPQSGGTLPTNLSEGVYYFVVYVDADNFKLSSIQGGLNIINLSGGSGIWEVAKDVDVSKYIESDGADSPNANLEWICQKIFEVCGLTLDTSLATWDFITGYKFDEIVLDVNQFYAINQDVAGNNTLWDSSTFLEDKDYSRQSNKITFFDFINVILSWQGASLRYKGNLTYEIRRDSGTISASPEYDYDEETIKQETGITYIEERYNTSRASYKSPTESSIDTQFTNRDLDRSNEISYFNNLIFYRRSGTSDVGSKIDALTIVGNKVLDKEKTWTKETFITDIEVSIYNYRENLIDFDLAQSVITQDS